ncbi:hypothetical protein GCM10011515_09780 [Tsuneonella deserti]|uniref:YbjN domain-containing protein n=1 Tax=Tsuneonella deserti TaxID=2035528 RepID=A0ABQ1S6B6_9SPHN|nr:YbjN domain-containing protein [Tsuneonella deserti]GGD92140.1 hypothetical protein GCM10011515_09780 [Tsuneonella deserti]
MFKPVCALLAALASVAAMPASAAEVRAQDVASVVTAMKKAGYKADLTQDGVGDPMITSALDGTKFVVLFYNCTEHVDCRTIQFSTGYTGSSADVNDMNKWNSSQRFGRAYIDDEGDPALQMDIDLDDGGISQALFEDNLEFWASLVPRFEDAIGN